MNHSTVAIPPDPVNVAVVGLGFMGTIHLRAYLNNPSARVVAVCGVDRIPVNGVLAGIAGNIAASDSLDLGGNVKVYEQFEDLLADPQVQLVDLCTPTPCHPDQSIAALRAGKHVLCEKPVAGSSAVARTVVETARTARGFFMPAMCLRFWPGWAGLKRIVDEQTHGKVLAARFSRHSEMPAWSRNTYAQGSDSGGALFDLHIHDTDFVQYLFGKPNSVFSTGVVRDGSSIDHVVTQYHFDGGPAVHAEGSWLLAQGFNMAFTLLCERATVEYDIDRGAEALRIREAGQPVKSIPADGDGYVEEIRYLLQCIQSGTPPAIVTAADSVRTLEICEAEEKSVRTGQPVSLK